jgi:hypothetical protein
MAMEFPVSNSGVTGKQKGGIDNSIPPFDV